MVWQNNLFPFKIRREHEIALSGSCRWWISIWQLMYIDLVYADCCRESSRGNFFDGEHSIRIRLRTFAKGFEEISQLQSSLLLNLKFLQTDSRFGNGGYPYVWCMSLGSWIYIILTYEARRRRIVPLTRWPRKRGDLFSSDEQTRQSDLGDKRRQSSTYHLWYRVARPLKIHILVLCTMEMNRSTSYWIHSEDKLEWKGWTENVKSEESPTIVYIKFVVVFPLHVTFRRYVMYATSHRTKGGT